jgi:non-specific protein-tyrosine kinase
MAIFRKPTNRPDPEVKEERPAVPQETPIHFHQPVRPSDHKKTGWVSPTYSVSRPAKLDAGILEANRCIGHHHEAAELEYYKVLRTQILRRSNGGGGVTVMVTSALPGEGKTLTAINLAFAFAREYEHTALLVDCDLKRQRIHEVLGIPSDKGLVDHLIDDCPIHELFVWPGVEKLTLVSGGKTVRDSSELLGSPGMKNLVHEMKNRYPERFIFFDVPPVLTSADPLAFAPFVDYILITVQAGETSLQDVKRATALLPSEKVLGFVMNRQQKSLMRLSN